MKPSNKLL